MASLNMVKKLDLNSMRKEKLVIRTRREMNMMKFIENWNALKDAI